MKTSRNHKGLGMFVMTDSSPLENDHVGEEMIWYALFTVIMSNWNKLVGSPLVTDTVTINCCLWC